MACTYNYIPEWQAQDPSRITSSHPQDYHSPSFVRTRRPALIPSDSSLSLTEARDLVRTRIQQPLFPPPDPRLLQDTRPASLATSDVSMTDDPRRGNEARRSRESSPTSRYSHADDSIMPPALARDPQFRKNWLKARAQYARDRQVRQGSTTPPKTASPEREATPPRKPASLYLHQPRPARKQSAFIKEEELRCMNQDRVGTPHISELGTDDDVSTQIRVDELNIGGRVAAMHAAGELSESIDDEDNMDIVDVTHHSS